MAIEFEASGPQYYCRWHSTNQLALTYQSVALITFIYLLAAPSSLLALTWKCGLFTSLTCNIRRCCCCLVWSKTGPPKIWDCAVSPFKNVLSPQNYAHHSRGSASSVLKAQTSRFTCRPGSSWQWIEPSWTWRAVPLAALVPFRRVARPRASCPSPRLGCLGTPIGDTTFPAVWMLAEFLSSPLQTTLPLWGLSLGTARPPVSGGTAAGELAICAQLAVQNESIYYQYSQFRTL